MALPLAPLAQMIIMQANNTDSESEFTSSSVEDFCDFSYSSDSSSDICDSRRKLRKVMNFVEDTVDQYDEKQFKEHFRMNRATCNVMIDRITTDKVLPDHTFGKEKITPKKGFLITVWYLSNQETFQQIGDRFNVAKSSVYRVLVKIVKYLVNNSAKYIKWPNAEKKNVIRQGFKNFKGIDGIIGAIDGCHIPIKRPLKDAENRKSVHSILLQGVCDNRKKFIDIFCGEAGSIQDAHLLKKSAIYRKGIDGFLGDDFLLGDSAYPCLQWLITPFKNNGHLTKNQTMFNYRHSASRIVIENAYGLLKGRFRRLKYFESKNTMFIVKCVIAATVLHNICLDLEDYIEHEDDDGLLQQNGEEFNPDINIATEYSKRNELFANMFI